MPAKLKSVNPYCQRSDCKKLARQTVRMWGEDRGSWCDEHAEELAASMNEFDDWLDRRKIDPDAPRHLVKESDGTNT